MSAALPLALIALAVWTSGPPRTAAARLTALRPRPDPRRETRLPLPWLVCAAGTAVGWSFGGALLAAVAGAGGWWGATRLLRPRPPPVDQLGVAAGWDLLAACLVAGLPVPTAVRVVADDLPERAGAVLRGTADLLAMGADPATAWAGALECPETAELARGARRSARSGAALAGVARDLAAGARERVADLAEEKAQRASVRVTGPLGLCFLPAFLCLGIAPVVIGVVSRLAAHF
ncbi:type II secretion system F family protein [Actinokineospora bangkokensis]|uniref:Type II secretion system protein GspF domain-containing protein n=1 Tax=Actinokineospora bangkokensis TaxID=1193682 RepID=A0A1Q9LCI4_9PSEU|nr:type II secretion system F family protein [Actinokineospora bangkokensis]OLR89724.1 hypothetical protein BJP25_01435 [Actinokineospora bangkokensis]